MGAATVNRISAMLKSGMTPTVYDQRWIPLLNAIDANQALNGQETSDPKDESGVASRVFDVQNIY